MTAPEEFNDRKVRIYPVTRIQGRADIEILFTPNNEVDGARFRALEYRGFEEMVRSMPVLRVPQLLSRICGSCGSYHQLAACMALEDALEVEVSDSSRVFRELLCYLWLANQHLITITYLALPDLALPMSDTSVRNVTGIYTVEQEIVGRLSALQSQFFKALGILAGLPVHPSVVVPGGVSRLPDEDDVNRVRDFLDGCEDGLRETLRLVEVLLKRGSQMMYTGTPLSGHYMTTISQGNPSLLGDTVEARPFGEDEPVSSPAGTFSDSLEASPVEWSYIVPVRTGGLSEVLTGPLARVNFGFGPDTAWAQLECNRCAEQWGSPLDREFLVYNGLMLEVIWAWEKAGNLLGEMNSEEEPCAEISVEGATGQSVLDTPRGLLVHSVSIDESGAVETYAVRSPLQFNYPLLNSHLAGVADKVVAGAEISETIAQRLQLAVRAFTPCVSCGAH